VANGRWPIVIILTEVMGPTHVYSHELFEILHIMCVHWEQIGWTAANHELL